MLQVASVKLLAAMLIYLFYGTIITKKQDHNNGEVKLLVYRKLIISITIALIVTTGPFLYIQSNWLQVTYYRLYLSIKAEVSILAQI